MKGRSTCFISLIHVSFVLDQNVHNLGVLAAYSSMESRPVLGTLRVDVDLTCLEEVQDSVDFALVCIFMQVGIFLRACDRDSGFSHETNPQRKLNTAREAEEGTPCNVQANAVGFRST